MMFWVTSLKCTGRKGGFEVGEMKLVWVVTSSFNTRTVGGKVNASVGMKRKV